MLGKGRNIGKVKSFLHQVDSSRLNDDGIDNYLFINALDVLKIWSSTLKSIRRTFPLIPGIFDYVIFDEASQVDLPSADNLGILNLLEKNETFDIKRFIYYLLKIGGRR